METSLMLARLIGPVMVVMGAYILLRTEHLARAAREILDSAALLMIAGLLAFVPGLAIVLAHNVWVAGWPVIVTLLGWIAMLAGLARMFMPDTMRRVGATMLDRPRVFFVGPGLVMLALGGFLCLKGFQG